MVTINGDGWMNGVTIDGDDWMNCKSNLKELCMDDSVFHNNEWVLEYDKMADLENEEYAGIFLFYKCTSKVLERVSIKNAKFGRYVRDSTASIYGGDHNFQEDILAIPQTALIKFIRNAPASLRWFRSDLSDENITMLQKERPEIEFAN